MPRYARQQLTRPRVEFGCDHGRERLVLARTARFDLCFRRGHTTWSGRGSSRYAAASVDVYARDGQRAAAGRMGVPIFEGAITNRKLQDHADAICAALEVTFDVTLVRRDLTLLLDEEGVPEAPPKPPRKPAGPGPRARAGQPLYRVTAMPGHDEGYVVRIDRYTLVRESAATVWAVTAGSTWERLFSKEKEPLYPTRAEAIAAFLDRYRQPVLDLNRQINRLLERHRDATDELAQAEEIARVLEQTDRVVIPLTPANENEEESTDAPTQAGGG